jgi:membrane protein
VLVAVVPLVLLLVGGVGFLVGDRLGGVSPDVVELLVGLLPQGSGVEIAEGVERLMAGLVAERAGLSLVGALVLAWISTRLAGTLRIVLRHVFEVQKERGLVVGKLFDFGVVLGAGALVLVNFGVTLGARAVERFGLNVLGDIPGVRWIFSWSFGTALSLGTAWILFFLLYRYLPARSVSFRVAAVGATFATVGFELLKVAFAWYVTSVANYSNAYGSLSAGAVLFFWIYYSSILFVLGGVLARTVELHADPSGGVEQEHDVSSTQPTPPA